MANVDPKQTSLKRKHSKREDAGPVTLKLSGLEMLTDEEDDDYDPNDTSDEDEVDEFPEIDPSSDSEDDDEKDFSHEEDDEEDGSDQENSSAESELNVFPKSKTVISDITGQPKKVYPDIEPDYDSDSSTEEVWAPGLYFSELH